MVDLLGRIAEEPQNLTAITGLEEGIDRHLADSLAGLALPEVASAAACVDIGSGVGFPGLALAIARPEMAVTLVESERRKADWLRRASAAIPNVRVVSDRSEHLAAVERESYPLATMRALGPLPVALELAAPLVALGGAVVAWRGDDADPERRGRRPPRGRRAGPRARGRRSRRRPSPAPAAGCRSSRKVAATPARFPRRPGRAAKRPLGGVRA